MAELLQIKDGTTTINLLNTSGIAGLVDGWVPATPKEHNNLHEIVKEVLEITIDPSNEDNLAVQLIELEKLLRKAWQFHNTTWQTTPVYLVSQGENETNPRYALLHNGRYSGAITTHDPVVKGNQGQIPTATLELWREAGWRDAIPGAYTSAVTLINSDGPASPTLVHIANHTDDHALTHIFVEDNSDGPSYSANQIASDDFDLFPNPVGVNDKLYIGSTTGPFHHVVLKTDGAAGTNIGNWDYYNGSFTDMSSGVGNNMTSWPTLNNNDAQSAAFWRSAGELVVNISDVGDWVVTTINGIEAYWIRFEWTTGANTFKQTGQVVYAQRKNYIEIGGIGTIVGDLPPHTLMAFGHPVGNLTTPDFRTTSRIVMGARSSPTARFTPNIVFDSTAMDEYWDTSTINVDDADTTIVADEDAPAGKHAAVTFSASESLIKRVAVEDSTGGVDNPVLLDYVGEYQVLIICQQISGAVGDTSVQFVFEDGVGVRTKSEQVELAAKDAGLEVVDVGIVRIPATNLVANDDLTTTFQITNSFGVYAARSTGAGTMRIYEIFLLPIDEWAATLNSPIIDTALALEMKSRQRLEMDSGILRPRVLRTFEDYSRTLADRLPIGEWELHGTYPILEPETQYRVYFKLMNYNAAVGTGPFIAPLGKHLAIELRTVDRYATLRGAD